MTVSWIGEVIFIIGVIALIAIVWFVQAKLLKRKTTILDSIKHFASNVSSNINRNFLEVINSIFVFGIIVEATTAACAVFNVDFFLLTLSKFVLIALIEWATMSFGIWNLKRIGKSWEMLGCNFKVKMSRLIVSLGVITLLSLGNYFGYVTPYAIYIAIGLGLIFTIVHITTKMIMVHIIPGIIFPVISISFTFLLIYFSLASIGAVNFESQENIRIGGFILDINKLSQSQLTITSITVMLASVVLGFTSFFGYNANTQADLESTIYGIQRYIKSFRAASAELLKAYGSKEFDLASFIKKIEASKHRNSIELWIISAEAERLKLMKAGSEHKDITPAYVNYYKTKSIMDRYIQETLVKIKEDSEFDPGTFKMKK
jgi:hypothetical protein